MRTLAFCTSYAESKSAWTERWGRWMRAMTCSGLQFDQLLIVDDGSPVLPTGRRSLYRRPTIPTEATGFVVCTTSPTVAGSM